MDLGREDIRVNPDIDLATRIVIHLDFNAATKPRAESSSRRPAFVVKQASKLLAPLNRPSPWISLASSYNALVVPGYVI